MTVTTVVGVPHPARTRAELVDAVGARLDGPDPPLLLAGAVAMELGDPDSAVTVEVDGPHPAMREAFAAAGRGAFDGAELDDIAAHGTCAYLVAEDGGTCADAARVLRAARGVLLAGGLGVKVESAGVATTAARWLAFGRDPTPGDLVEAFVAYVTTPDGGVRSCGMHNLGLPDVRTPPLSEPGGAAHLAMVVCTSLALDAPVLSDGQTFGLTADGPGYRLFLGPDTAAPPDDIFHNPFGAWTLTPT